MMKGNYVPVVVFGVISIIAFILIGRSIGGVCENAVNGLLNLLVIVSESIYYTGAVLIVGGVIIQPVFLNRETGKTTETGFTEFVFGGTFLLGVGYLFQMQMWNLAQQATETCITGIGIF